MLNPTTFSAFSEEFYGRARAGTVVDYVFDLHNKRKTTMLLRHLLKNTSPDHRRFPSHTVDVNHSHIWESFSNSNKLFLIIVNFYY